MNKELETTAEVCINYFIITLFKASGNQNCHIQQSAVEQFIRRLASETSDKKDPL
jgi:hypothetical protein